MAHRYVRIGGEAFNQILQVFLVNEPFKQWVKTNPHFAFGNRSAELESVVQSPLYC